MKLPERSARFLLPLLLLAACSRAEPERPSIGVWAAASLRDVLSELGPRAEAATRSRIIYHYGSSSDLARQIVGGAPVEVFVSADVADMDHVGDAGLVEFGTRRSLVSNRLVVIVPAQSSRELFATPFDPSRLADPRIERLSLGDALSVPAGRYARSWLDSLGLWSKVADRVVPAADVRAALAAVESGACQAGIVYLTDAARSTRVRVVHTVPAEEGPQIVYVAAAIHGRPHIDESRALLEFLASPEASEVFRLHGFTPLSPSSD